MRFKRSVVVLLVLASVAGTSLLSHAQLPSLGIWGFDPRLAWRTLTTEHFRIHFLHGLEGVAHQVARIAEDSYRTLLEEFGQAPPVVDLVIADPVDIASGFANPFLDQIVIFTSQQRLSEWANARLDSWWEVVTFHELVHALDQDQTRGISALLQAVFGKVVLPNVIKPVPFVEGLAVYEEYKHLGESRLNDSRTRMMLRQMVLDNEIPRFDEIKGFYSRSTWPDLSLLWYRFGAWFMRYIEEIYGQDALKKLSEVNAGRPLNLLWPLGLGANLDRVAKEALAASADELYRGFRAWLRERFLEEIRAIRSRGVTEAVRITTHGFWTGGPAWSPDGRWIAYTHSSPERAGLRLVQPDGERDHELISDDTIAAPAWSPDGKALIYAKQDFAGPYAMRSDLYRYDLEAGREVRLTRGERAYFARVAPDGSHVYYARNVGHDGGTALAVLDLETREARIVQDFSEMGGVIHSFALSPEGGRVALALWRPGGYQDLYLMPAGGGRLVPLTADKSEVADPVWSPDGKYILFGADPDRVDNLYAYRVDDKRAFRITSALTGAFSPAVSPQGDEIAFLGYDSAGYDLYRLPYDPQSWTATTFPQVTVPEWTGYPSGGSPVSPYDPLPLLLPKFWLPLPLSAGVGAVTAGTDPLFKQAYGVLAGWDFQEDRLVYRVGYLHNGSPQVTFALSGDRSGSRQALSVRLPLSLSRNRRQLFTVGYERAAASEAASVGEPRVTHTLSGSYEFTHLFRRELFRDRLRVTVSGALINVETTGAWHRKLVLDWREQFRLPVLGGHLMTARAAAGWTDAEAEGFELGGPGGRFQLRGFPAGAFTGRQAVSAGLEYRFPLFSIERSLGGWPLFVDDLGGGLFVDAGTAGDGLHLQKLRVGFGVELTLSLTLGYRAPLAIKAGVAQGMGEALPVLYLDAELPELF